MGGLDSYNQIAVAVDHFGRRSCVHVRRILLRRTPIHTAANNVQPRKHTDSGRLHHVFPKGRKVAPARSAGVHRGSDSGAQRMTVGVQSGSGRSGEVRMDVHKSGHDVHAGYIDRLQCSCRIDQCCNRFDFATGDGDIPKSVDAVLTVDQMTALQEQVIGLCVTNRCEQ